MNMNEIFGFTAINNSEFSEKLLANGKTMEFFLKKSFLLGFAACFIAIAVCFELKMNSLYITAFSFAAFFAAIFLNYFFELYSFELRKQQKEALVPDLLLEASAFPRGISMNKILKFFARADFGLLGKEFELALLEIEKGASFESALENVKKRCKSRVIDRAIDLIIRGYESGADLSAIFRASADDFFETNAILRERNAALVIEKYTLLFAGGLIVPAILGLLAGMVSGIDFSGLSGILEFGLENSARKALLETAVFSNQVYIAEYAILASFFLAMQEGNSKKAILYALFLLPVSFGVNALAKIIVF